MPVPSSMAGEQCNFVRVWFSDAASQLLPYTLGWLTAVETGYVI